MQQRFGYPCSKYSLFAPLLWHTIYLIPPKVPVIQTFLSSSYRTDETLIWCRFVYHDAYHIFGINAFEWIIFSLRVEDSTTYLPPSVHISFSVLDNKASVGHLSHLPKVLLINERADEDCSFSQRLRKCIANEQGWIKSSLPGIFIPNSFRTVRRFEKLSKQLRNCPDNIWKLSGTAVSPLNVRSNRWHLNRT